MSFRDDFYSPVGGSSNSNSLHLETILKTVERCNIGCKYCYFFYGGDDSYKVHPPYISRDTLIATAEFLAAGAQSMKIDSMQIDIHGGEPLMQRKRDFDAMCELFRDVVGSCTTLNLVVQTNAMLIDEEWIDLFSKHNIAVGVSLDGPSEYNDEYRVDHRGRGTYDRVIAGLELLRSAYDRDVLDGCFSILCVINPARDPRRIYRHFVDDLGCSAMDFLLPDINHETINGESPEAFGDYLCELFDEWSSDDDPDIGLRFFQTFIAKLYGQSSFMFGNTESNDVNDVLAAITISSNGDIGPDDTLRSTGVWDTCGNVSNTSLDQVLNAELFGNIVAAQKTPPQECRSCCWMTSCGGGQLVHRYRKSDGLNAPSVFCEGLKPIYSSIVAYLIEHGRAPAELVHIVLSNSKDTRLSVLEQNR